MCVRCVEFSVAEWSRWVQSIGVNEVVILYTVSMLQYFIEVLTKLAEMVSSHNGWSIMLIYAQRGTVRGVAKPCNNVWLGQSSVGWTSSARSKLQCPNRFSALSLLALSPLLTVLKLALTCCSIKRLGHQNSQTLEIITPEIVTVFANRFSKEVWAWSSLITRQTTNHHEGISQNMSSNDWSSANQKRREKENQALLASWKTGQNPVKQ